MLSDRNDTHKGNLLNVDNKNQKILSQCSNPFDISTCTTSTKTMLVRCGVSRHHAKFYKWWENVG